MWRWPKSHIFMCDLITKSSYEQIMGMNSTYSFSTKIQLSFEFFINYLNSNWSIQDLIKYFQTWRKPIWDFSQIRKFHFLFYIFVPWKEWRNIYLVVQINEWKIYSPWKCFRVQNNYFELNLFGKYQIYFLIPNSFLIRKYVLEFYSQEENSNLYQTLESSILNLKKFVKFKIIILNQISNMGLNTMYIPHIVMWGNNKTIFQILLREDKCHLS
jgi:hypothetical protein